MSKTYGPTERPPFPKLPRKRRKSGAPQGGLGTLSMLSKVESGSKRTPIEVIRESARQEKRWRLALNPELSIVEGLRGMVEGTRKHFLATRSNEAWDLHLECLDWLRVNTPPLSGFNVVGGSVRSLKFG